MNMQNHLMILEIFCSVFYSEKLGDNFSVIIYYFTCTFHDPIDRVCNQLSCLHMHQ